MFVWDESAFWVGLWTDCISWPFYYYEKISVVNVVAWSVKKREAWFGLLFMTYWVDCHWRSLGQLMPNSKKST